jgi:hypothetical protein
MKKMGPALGFWLLFVSSGCYTRVDFRFDEDTYYADEEACPPRPPRPPHPYPPAAVVFDPRPVPQPVPHRPPERRNDSRPDVEGRNERNRPAPEIRRDRENSVLPCDERHPSDWPEDQDDCY